MENWDGLAVVGEADLGVRKEGRPMSADVEVGADVFLVFGCDDDAAGDEEEEGLALVLLEPWSRRARISGSRMSSSRE